MTVIEKGDQAESQYSLTKILGIWAGAALPMAILSWVVNPLLAPSLDPLVGVKGITRVMVLIVGLIWQFVLSLVIVYGEEENLRWSTIKKRCWLNAPRDPKTGEPRRKLWLWLIPFSLLFPAFLFGITPALNRFWVSLFPFLAEPRDYSFANFVASPENRAHLVGAWWFFGLFMVLAVFNTFLGEELLFRGVLLPRMRGVFGKWDWAANGVLFGLYHLHQPWGIPGGILIGALLFAFPAKYFRSTWMAVIVHSGQSVFFGFVILRLVLGFT